MRLKNKKTGYVDNWCIDKDVIRTCDGSIVYNSLSELTEEWEDYEELKKYYYLDYSGRIKAMNDANDEEDIARKAIGNYFETKEEAEKAVEKLKVFKRLKDKGFRFDGWDENHHNLGIIEFSFDKVENNVWDFEKDLNLLFGGEE